MSAGIS